MMEEKNIINWIQNSIKERNANGLILDTSKQDASNELLLNICKKSHQNIYCVSSNKDFHEHDVTFNISEKPLFTIIEEANRNNLLTINSYNFIDINVTKPWQNHCFIWDLLPFGDLFLKDIYFLLKKNYNKEPYYEDCLWAYQMNDKFNNILYSEQDPSKNWHWSTLNIKQKQIIANLYSNIKNNKHKKITGKIYYGTDI